ncbi:MAG: sel1 repeat family protein [Zoogloeaceae bacterium]|nr:sel1 repeat family protein [Zoogloeaceae bacterium]
MIRTGQQFLLLTPLIWLPFDVLAASALVHGYKSTPGNHGMTYWEGEHRSVADAEKKALQRCNAYAVRCQLLASTEGPMHWAYYYAYEGKPPLVILGTDKQDLMHKLDASCRNRFGSGRFNGQNCPPPPNVSFKVDNTPPGPSESEQQRLALRNFYGIDKPVTATGKTVGRSPQETLDLAQKGNAEAQFELSEMYANGKGVLKDDHAALTWLTKAANANLPAANLSLGKRYEQGNGVKQSRPTAYVLYEKAGASTDMARVDKLLTTSERTLLLAYKKRQQEAGK